MSSGLERRRFIRNMLESEGIVQVTDLALKLSVSEMTIRRDLSQLEQFGIARRTHGGAEKLVSRSYEPPFDLRVDEWAEEKRRIAETALRYVNEGDTVAIDSGTTALEFAKLLLDYRNLTIVTPSLRIALLFLAHPTISVIVSGGEMRSQEGSLVGEFTERFFADLYFDTFFLSTAGVNADAGLTEYIVKDAAIKRLIVAHSTRTVALMLSTKFNKINFSKVCALEAISALVTDSEPQNQLYRALTEAGVEVRVASEARGGTEH